MKRFYTITAVVMVFTVVFIQVINVFFDVEKTPMGVTIACHIAAVMCKGLSRRL